MREVVGSSPTATTIRMFTGALHGLPVRPFQTLDLLCLVPDLIRFSPVAPVPRNERGPEPLRMPAMVSRAARAI
jgi:hypothetical protein